jgi:choline dehydrogenase-like flavoprotein
MFHDARTIPNNAALETDVCIIGGGAAGITLALEFSGQPFRVSVLESGGRSADTETQQLATGENTGLPYYPLEASRLRFFGGTTNHWGGTCRPFDPIDFERRDWIANSGWPLTRDDLQPYYQRAEPICHVHAAGAWDIDSWVAQDTARPFPLAGGRMYSRVAQIVSGADRRFGPNYREAVEHASNVTAYFNANVLEIVANDSLKSVSHLRVATLTRNTFSIQARLFILAAGGIENARLLLLSNKQQPAGLANQNDLVGRFFMEHPRFEPARIVPSNPLLATRFYEMHHVAQTGIKGYIGLTPETLRKEQLTDVQITLDPVYDSSLAEAVESRAVQSVKTLLRTVRRGTKLDDFGAHVANVLSDFLRWQDSAVGLAPVPIPKPEVLSTILDSSPAEREYLIKDLFGDVAFAAYADFSGNIPLDYIRVGTRIDPVPNPMSRVTLGSTRDQLGQPRAQLHWQLSPLDKQSVRRTLEIFGAELGAADLGRLQIDLSDDDTEWPDDTRGGWHHMGTTRMSDDPKQGVVDKNCQVHGMDNFFIAGSSVFPTSGSGTPTLTLVSLALRLADQIKERMR